MMEVAICFLECLVFWDFCVFLNFFGFLRYVGWNGIGALDGFIGESCMQWCVSGV